MFRVQKLWEVLIIINVCLLSFYIHTPTTGKIFEMKVVVPDYLRILEGGNFINFVAMALVPEEKLSVVQTYDFRLTVRGHG